MEATCEPVAFNKPNFVNLYANLCAYMINYATFNELHNTETTFQLILAQKCFEGCTSQYTSQEEVSKLKENFKKNTPSNFKNRLNTVHFQYYNSSLTHCKFIGELFKQGALNEKNILACIDELMKVNDDQNIHCLCTILQIAGPKLSKTHNLDSTVYHILSFKIKNLDLIKISPTLKSSIFIIQYLNFKGWIINEEAVKLIESNENHSSFEKLPEESKKSYELKSHTVMAQCIIDECIVVLNNFDEKNERSIKEIVRMLNNINSWIKYDQVSFVASLILITLNESQSIRYKAGILLNKLVTERLLSRDSVSSGIDKVMNDSELKIELPKLSDLLFDIASKLYGSEKKNSIATFELGAAENPIAPPSCVYALNHQGFSTL
ncbi:uncharacterized protein LOC112693352 [Sipha flava]|uniref:Uncharacterized protein LOC112693352 n=1 Tax=Sipha flava TaxID=143950 RepID=A0A8B8GM63_9HEMI|nr:uncharacterized protein LOC112693352 [Sipha flava]